MSGTSIRLGPEDRDAHVAAQDHSMTAEEVFDMVREYRGAPSNTASAMTVDQWREAWLAEWQRANRAEVVLDEIAAKIGDHRGL